jgi:iron complex transport system permease protein
MRDKQIAINFTHKLLLGLFVFCAMFIVAMIFGAADISIKDIWMSLSYHELGDKAMIIREIRLPRVIAGIFVGAALAVSGAIMQGITRNPLADPGLLGLTSGANAALAITMAFAVKANYFAIMVTCFFGAAVGAVFVFGIGAIKKGGFSPLRIVLAGAAVSAFLHAITEGVGIYFRVSKDVTMWTSGGLLGTSWSQLRIVVPFIAVGILIALLVARQLTILSLSEEVAVGLGQKIFYTKTILFLVIIILAGASVALAGNLAFIGLMIPHIVRSMVGTDYRIIIPMSAIFGATTILIADTLARTVNAPFETPVSAIVAIIGLPFFLFILRKGSRVSL